MMKRCAECKCADCKGKGCDCCADCNSGDCCCNGALMPPNTFLPQNIPAWVSYPEHAQLVQQVA